MVKNRCTMGLFGVVFTIIFALPYGIARADQITYSKNVVERFSHKDWVAYKTDSGHCRPTTEFLIGGTIASLAVLRRDSSDRDTHAWLHVYGEYVNGVVEVRLDGSPIRWRTLKQETIQKLAEAKDFTLTARLYTELPPQAFTQDIVQIPKTEDEAKVSLAGSSAALRFCNFID